MSDRPSASGHSPSTVSSTPTVAPSSIRAGAAVLAWARAHRSPKGGMAWGVPAGSRANTAISPASPRLTYTLPSPSTATSVAAT